MKRITVIILCLVIVLLLSGCGAKTEQSKEQFTENQQSETEKSDVSQFTENRQSETEKSDVSIPGFSYAKDCAIYVVGEPGVKTSGFVNTNEKDVNSDNVTEIAEHECTIEYDSTKVYYDTIARIWKVDFFTQGMDGGCQTVYLDSNGITVLVVYGE
ncbi:MAG: hypothetical protein MJ102_06820 [Clostridia bacterium]|nr:hypothetical protein [Clostridia bacterium]